MSRSNPTVDLVNPAKVVLEWAAGANAGHLKYYNRETKEKCTIATPFKFAVLDERVTIMGYHKASNSGIFAPEVEKTSSEDLKVMTYVGGAVKVLIEGLYGDIKEKVKAMGGNFHKVIYASVIESKDPYVPEGSVVRLAFKGSAVSAWGDFKNPTKGGVEVGYKQLDNGNVTYRAPVFTPIDITDEQGDLADQQDVELQEFFKAKKMADWAREEEKETTPSPAATTEEVEEEVPF